MTWFHSSVQKSKPPNPGTQVLSQIHKDGEGNRGQMPHICPPPLWLSIDSCISPKMYDPQKLVITSTKTPLNQKVMGVITFETLSLDRKMYLFFLSPASFLFLIVTVFTASLLTISTSPSLSPLSLFLRGFFSVGSDLHSPSWLEVDAAL